jgi:uncharacterized membrane protein YcfT
MLLAGLVLLILGLVGPSESQRLNAIPLLAGLWLLIHAYRAFRNGRLKSAPSPRFALSTLLAVVTSTALFMGFAQWRRQVLVREVLDLQGYGVEGLSVSDHWLWPTVSSTVLIHEVVMPPESHSSALETVRLYEEITARLNRLGVTVLSYEVLLLDGPSPNTVMMKTLDELREHVPVKK